MAVLVTAEVPGQTKEGYDGMLAGGLGDAVRHAKGFIMHVAAETADVWRIIEVWDTAEDANQFFAKFVHPNLPPGIKPKRSFQELHNVLTP